MTGLADIIPWFGVAAGASLVLVVGAFFARDKSASGLRLEGLNAWWSIRESWASNLTAGSTILLAIIGASDVVKEMFGEDANVLGIVIVASGVSAGLVALAPLVLNASRTADGRVHAVGLGVASLFTLTGIGGEVAVATVNADHVLGSTHPWISFAGVVVALLVAVYGVRSLADLYGRTEADAIEAAAPSRRHSAIL